MKKYLGALAVAISATAFTAADVEAASLSLVGGSNYILPANNSLGFAGLMGKISSDLSVLPVGTTLRFEFLGFEAGFTNTSAVTANVSLLPTALFKNKGTGASAVGDIVLAKTTGDPITLSFGVDVGSNGSVDYGFNSASANIFMAQISPNEAIVGLEDFRNGGDGDYDDLMYRVSAVPVPAAIPLFLSGLAGMGVIARRRMTA